MIESTMQDFPLGIQHLFNHGRAGTRRFRGHHVDR